MPDCPPDCPKCNPQFSTQYLNHFGKHIRRDFRSVHAAMDWAISVDKISGANGEIIVRAGESGVAIFGTTAKKQAPSG